MKKIKKMAVEAVTQIVNFQKLSEKKLHLKKNAGNLYKVMLKKETNPC